MSKVYDWNQCRCYHYEKEDKSSLEVLNLPGGTVVEKDTVDTELAFLVRGKFRLFYGKILNQEVAAGKIMLFPPGSHIRTEIEEDSQILVVRIRGIVQLCECLSIQHIYENGEIVRDGFHLLDINHRVGRYTEDLLEDVRDGIKCHYYYETKIKELFFLLRAYYTREQLSFFFAPLLSHDAQFMNLMYRNYRNVKSVQELVSLSMYSNSGFKKQFQRVFGISASVWLRERKASMVFQELNSSALSIKEIADKYHFASVSSFSTFCLNNFGLPPGKIRNGKLGKNCPGKSDGK